MSNYINKTEARELLKGVKKDQFLDNLRKKYGYEIGALSKVIKSTDKALLLKTTRGSVWIAKSSLILEYRELGERIDVAFLYPKKYTTEERKEMRGDCNSVWASIFNKQDQNGLTANGYAL